jgi:hypothetical protein
MQSLSRQRALDTFETVMSGSQPVQRPRRRVRKAFHSQPVRSQPVRAELTTCTTSRAQLSRSLIACGPVCAVESMALAARPKRDAIAFGSPHSPPVGDANYCCDGEHPQRMAHAGLSGHAHPAARRRRTSDNERLATSQPADRGPAVLGTGRLRRQRPGVGLRADRAALPACRCAGRAGGAARRPGLWCLDHPRWSVRRAGHGAAGGGRFGLQPLPYHRAVRPTRSALPTEQNYHTVGVIRNR